MVTARDLITYRWHVHRYILDPLHLRVLTRRSRPFFAQVSRRSSYKVHHFLLIYAILGLDGASRQEAQEAQSTIHLPAWYDSERDSRVKKEKASRGETLGLSKTLQHVRTTHFLWKASSTNFFSRSSQFSSRLSQGFICAYNLSEQPSPSIRRHTPDLSLQLSVSK